MDTAKLHSRLKRIAGQVQGIDRMIEEEAPCEDILTQISAAKAALNKVGQIILEGHMNHCVLESLEKGNAEESIARFTEAIKRFANMQ